MRVLFCQSNPPSMGALNTGTRDWYNAAKDVAGSARNSGVIDTSNKPTCEVLHVWDRNNSDQEQLRLQIDNTAGNSGNSQFEGLNDRTHLTTQDFMQLSNHNGRKNFVTTYIINPNMRQGEDATSQTQLHILIRATDNNRYAGNGDFDSNGSRTYIRQLSDTLLTMLKNGELETPRDISNEDLRTLLSNCSDSVRDDLIKSVLSDIDSGSSSKKTAGNKLLIELLTANPDKVWESMSKSNVYDRSAVYKFFSTLGPGKTALMKNIGSLSVERRLNLYNDFISNISNKDKDFNPDLCSRLGELIGAGLFDSFSGSQMNTVMEKFTNKVLNISDNNNKTILIQNFFRGVQTAKIGGDKKGERKNAIENYIATLTTGKSGNSLNTYGALQTLILNTSVSPYNVSGLIANLPENDTNVGTSRPATSQSAQSTSVASRTANSLSEELMKLDIITSGYTTANGVQMRGIPETGIPFGTPTLTKAQFINTVSNLLRHSGANVTNEELAKIAVDMYNAITEASEAALSFNPPENIGALKGVFQGLVDNGTISQAYFNILFDPTCGYFGAAGDNYYKAENIGELLMKICEKETANVSAPTYLGKAKGMHYDDRPEVAFNTFGSASNNKVDFNTAPWKDLNRPMLIALLGLPSSATDANIATVLNTQNPPYLRVLLYAVGSGKTPVAIENSSNVRININEGNEGFDITIPKEFSDLLFAPQPDATAIANYMKGDGTNPRIIPFGTMAPQQSSEAIADPQQSKFTEVSVVDASSLASNSDGSYIVDNATFSKPEKDDNNENVQIVTITMTDSNAKVTLNKDSNNAITVPGQEGVSIIAPQPGSDHYIITIPAATDDGTGTRITISQANMDTIFRSRYTLNSENISRTENTITLGEGVSLTLPAAESTPSTIKLTINGVTFNFIYPSNYDKNSPLIDQKLLQSIFPDATVTGPTGTDNTWTVALADNGPILMFSEAWFKKLLENINPS